MSVQHRIRISAETRKLLDDAHDLNGHTDDVLIQLFHAAAGEGLEARLAREALAIRAASREKFVTDLADRCPNLRIAAIRLGPTISMNPTTEELWRVTHGHWVLGTRSNAIAPFRLGVNLGLFAGITWSAANDENRRYALSGYRVHDGLRLNPETGDPLGDASDEEIAAHRYLASHHLTMLAGAANPVVNLFK